MSRLQLVFPSHNYAKQINEYKQEFLEHREQMHGTAFLADYETISNWLSSLEKNRCQEIVAADLVPASLFLTVRKVDDQVVGMISIRHQLNDYLFRLGGHIGYSVRKRCCKLAWIFVVV